MSDLATNASLIVATLDLQVVKLLRGAIRATDFAGGRFNRQPLPLAVFDDGPVAADLGAAFEGFAVAKVAAYGETEGLAPTSITPATS